jgi:hypothetical protein
LIYQYIREGNYGHHLPSSAAPLRSEKVCDTVGRSGELEMTDVGDVALFIRKGICSTSVSVLDMEVNYLSQVG